MKRSLFIFLLNVSLSKPLLAQFEQNKESGFNLGLVSTFGTHVLRMGLVLQGYYFHDFAQANGALRVYYNFKNLGPKGEHFEINISAGACLAYGRRTNDTNVFISPIGNQTKYVNSVAYSYNIWLNKIKTSQVTGILAFQFDRFSLITENDILAKPLLDRFRTGAVLLQYQYQKMQFAINCTMWTGKMGQEVRNDTLFPYVGYMNQNGGVYSDISHGLLSAQVKYANFAGQYVQGNAGIDAEQVRNVVQNRIIHDMIILPRKWYKPINCHIPMMDTTGNQYLYRKDQKIRKPKLYLGASTCPNVFY